MPLSGAMYTKVIYALTKASPELSGLHGHLLRHTWNDRFSKYMDQLNDAPSPDWQEKMRSYQQGWKEGSGTAATYSRRFIERRVGEAQLKLQQNMAKKRRGDDA
jgi:integrase